MYLQKIHINNFRLLKDTEIILDPSLTLVVGKNNTGKTSIARLIRMVLDEKKSLSIDDYPLDCRVQLYDTIAEYWSGKINIEDIKAKISETKISFFVDYGEEDDNQTLGGLRPFIIDIDDTTTVARIDAVYHFEEQRAEELFSQFRKRYDQLVDAQQKDVVSKKGMEQPQKSKNEQHKNEAVSRTLCFEQSILTTVVKEQFAKLFSLSILAVNPQNESDCQERALSTLKDLFTCHIIDAERNLDESEGKNEHPLAGVMKRVFNPEEELISELNPIIDELNQYVDNLSFTASEKINSLMDKIVEGMVIFGYPSAEDMKLKANSNISLKRQVLSNTDLTYVTDDAQETLPSTHNGLGYKNLIKISLMLTEFARSVKLDTTKIPLLLIEEPEAHMHPQLQTTFVSFLESFLSRVIGEERHAQVILSSHSAHVANTVNFKQVRYMRRKKDNVICKDLRLFPKERQADEQVENLEFLQKYLKLSYCDLYFCDKAILVEGASERLLIPKMIIKCAESGAFGEEKPALPSQYYTVIEVGGAYAHRFYDFVDFLEIPTLILTDIDFVNSSNRKCQKDTATRSSNGAINRWCHDVYNIAVSNDIPLKRVLELADDSEKRTNGYKHLEFQKEENGVYPRSLEESIQNVNRDLFGIDADATEIPLFNDENIGDSKTDFAIMLLTDPIYENFTLPSYIRDGLVWLNNQNKIPAETIPTRKHKQLKRTKRESVGK